MNGEFVAAGLITRLLRDPISHGREVEIAALRGMTSEEPVAIGEINEAIAKSARINPSP